MESHFETARRVPLVIGGIPDLDRRETRYAIRIPGGLSLLAFHDLNARVTGLEEFPRADWPNVAIVHTAFCPRIGSAG